MAVNLFERLDYLAKTLNLTYNKLEQQVGWSRGTIGRLSKGTSLTYENLQKLFDTFDWLSPDWLVLGKGDIDKRNEKMSATSLEDSQKNERSKSAILPQVITVDKSGRENILMVGSKAFAGYTTNHQEAEYLRKLPAFGMPLPEFRNATFRAFQASGSSMEPTIWNGDWLIGQFVDDWDRSIQDGRIYIVVTRETILVKRVLNRMATGKIVIQSDNEVFPTDFINVEDVRELWYLKAKVSFQFPNTRYEVARRVANLEADLEELKRKLQSEE